MTSREYSKRLGTLTDEQLQAALDRFGLGRLLVAEPIANGLFGQNILLETTEGGFVFRGAPHWNPAGEDDWQFQKERYFSRLMHDSPHGAAVPWPYLLDESRDIFGWGYAFQPRLPGDVLQQPMSRVYSASEVAEQSYALGTALAAIHSVPVDLPGQHNPRTDTIQPIAGTYADYVESIIEELLSRSVSASSSTTEADVEWARSIAARARPAMQMPFQPMVVHLDYGFHNVLFEKQNGHWRLNGVIDWMTAEAGHPECDLARPLATDYQYRIGGRQAFMEAYRSVQPELPGFPERFPAFVLWERLLIWQYWQAQPKNPFRGMGMREWMERYVRIIV